MMIEKDKELWLLWQIEIMFFFLIEELKGQAGQKMTSTQQAEECLLRMMAEDPADHTDNLDNHAKLEVDDDLLNTIDTMVKKTCSSGCSCWLVV